MIDVPDVELDSLGPGKRRAPVDLGPAREPWPDIQPAPLVLVVLLHLVAQRRPRADHTHVSADDVPQLRQLVDRRSSQDPANAGDPRVALVDRVPGAEALCSHHHRAQLQDLEVIAVLPHASLPVEDRPAAVEFRR
jgi:hypothetical protein